MKLPLLAAGTFLISFAGSIGAFMVLYEPPEPETSADSTVTVQPIADTTGGDHAPVDEAAPDSLAEEPLDSTNLVPPTLAVDPSTLAAGLGPAGADAAAESSATNSAEESARQLARIISSMRGEEAAAVMKHLTDEEIVDVLTRLGTRQAAAILSGLPETRAAAISRRLLVRP